MKEGDYREASGLSQSQLKNFMVSPGYYKYSLANPKPQTEAMLLGTLAHTALLEPVKFMDNFAILPEVDRRTKYGKEVWEDFQNRNVGKTFIKQDMSDTVQSMVKSIKAHPLAGEILGLPDAIVEESFFFELLEVPCKARLDFYSPKANVVIDFKTSRSALSSDFIKDSINHGYDIQAYWYCQAYKSRFGYMPDFYAFLVAEKQAPYAVGVFSVDGLFMERGQYLAEKYLKKFKKCLETDVWPINESESVIGLTLPHWATKDYISTNDFMEELNEQ